MGTTSFLIQDYYIPAVKYVSGLCDDIALLVSEPGEKGENLITEKEVKEVLRIGRGEGITFNVHLPTEAHFETETSTRTAVESISLAIERTRVLEPHTYVLHIEYPSLTRLGAYADDESAARTADALQQIVRLLPSPEYLAIENLETFPPDFWDVWLEGKPYSRCFDIGHAWKDGLNPSELWDKWSSGIRMCHLHGLGTRDHQSVAHMPDRELDSIMHKLWKDGFQGAVTLEVFKKEEFDSSCVALLGSWERYKNNPCR